MKYGNRLKFVNWRIDADGFLRVTARVLKEGVFPYALSELPEDLQKTFHPDKTTINQYIPASQFTPEALSTLEGKPIIIIDHEWRDVDNTLKDGLTVGNTAGAPYVKDNDILVDFLITDPKAIDAITSGELEEVSAGYDGDLVIEAGMFGETPYDAIQTNLRFNHVLLLPVGGGRCGYEVRIINHKDKEKTMITHSVRIGNRERTFAFSSEQDKAEALRWLNEAVEEKDKELDEEKKKTEGLDMEKVKNAMDELPELQGKVQEHMETIGKLQEELAKLKDPEEQEKAAMELLETAQQTEDVMDTEVDEKDREEVTNSMKGCGNSAARVRALMTHIGNKRDMDITGMDDAAVMALFKFTAANSRKLIESAQKNRQTVPGAKEIVGTGKLQEATHILNSKGKPVHKLFAGMKPAA